jgi:hypothetical protein
MLFSAGDACAQTGPSWFNICKGGITNCHNLGDDVRSWLTEIQKEFGAVQIAGFQMGPAPNGHKRLFAHHLHERDPLDSLIQKICAVQDNLDMIIACAFRLARSATLTLKH